MAIPPVGPDGVRRTVNTGLDENTSLWHFRSVWNVAALNCVNPEDQPILDGYGAFLKDNAKTLTAANNAIDASYRKEHKARNEAVKAREAQMTGVYNYFALPGVRQGLCDTARAVAGEYLLAKPADIKAFALGNLARFESQYQQFFAAYEQYVTESRAWDARYGERYGPSQPGYVAVYGAGGHTIGTSLVAGEPQPAPTGAVVNPHDGAEIPIITLPQAETAVPIVQPVPTDAE